MIRYVAVEVPANWGYTEIAVLEVQPDSDFTVHDINNLVDPRIIRLVQKWHASVDFEGKNRLRKLAGIMALLLAAVANGKHPEYATGMNAQMVAENILNGTRPISEHGGIVWDVYQDTGMASIEFFSPIWVIEHLHRDV